MNDRLQYRVYDKRDNKLKNILGYTFSSGFSDLVHIQWTNGTYEAGISRKDLVFMQCTGLKDKNGLNRLFEYDIIDGEGIKIGNYYENKDLLKTTTNYLIKRMGTKEWRNSEQEAIKRGCFYAE